jgi:hypothetical protein
MNVAEIKAYLEENKENQEVKTFVEGLNAVSLDKVKSLASTDKDIKSWLDSEKDKHSTKSLKTWQDNNLQKLIDDKVKELYPQADPKDTELSKLKLEIEKMQKESLRKDLKNKALEIATAKKLPVELIDFMISDSDESTTKNLEKLESVFGTHVETLVSERLRNSSYTPPKGDNNTGITREMFQSMGYLERVKLSNDNPDLYKELSK